MLTLQSTPEEIAALPPLTMEQVVAIRSRALSLLGFQEPESYVIGQLTQDVKLTVAQLLAKF